MQRQFNIDKWQLVEDGKSVHFGRVEARRVRLDVNAPMAACIEHVCNGEVTFLGRVLGRDVIEFYTDGAFTLNVSGSELWFYTVDGEDYSFEIPDAVVITRIAERRARNPEFELMQYHANRNIELRLAQMRREIDEEWRRRGASEAPTPDVAPPTGGGKGGVKQPPSGGQTDGDAGDAGGADEGDGTKK